VANLKQLCDLLSIEYPIIQGGMGNISNAPLTAAVSEAGGLGTIGAGMMAVEEVERLIIETKQRTARPFAVNIPIQVSPYTEQLIDLMIQQKVLVVSLSAGNPAPFIPKLHQHGIKVLTLVSSVYHAKKAEAAGADALVAEGFEAAGINSNLELTTFALIPQIVANTKVPVIAAGGIGDGKGLAAALMLGASGVQMGTRFIATKEAPFHPVYKTKIVDAKDVDTMVLGRSVQRRRRVLKNPYAEKILEKEKEGLTVDEYLSMTTEERHIKGAIEGNMEQGFINGGQIAGLVSEVTSVREVIHSMMEEAKSRLAFVYNQFQ
jgi:enoyl-[acyl-carrier protein] reductase II